MAHRLTTYRSLLRRNLRDYGIGAQILAELGVHEMVLLKNTTHTPVALAGYGITIVGQRPLLELD